MKKVLSLILILSLAIFAACGHGKRKAKERQDSIRKDSITKARIADSLSIVDKTRLDSLKKDSIDKANKNKIHNKSKSKVKHKPTTVKKD